STKSPINWNLLFRQMVNSSHSFRTNTEYESCEFLISQRDRPELLRPLVARLGFCSRAGAAMARALCFNVPTPLARRTDSSKCMLRPAIRRNWHKAAAIGQADLNWQRMGGFFITP